MYDIIAELCEKHGMTVTEMCYETGVRQSTVANMKKRAGSLNPTNLYTIARYFGVSMEYLMGKEKINA